LWPIVYKVTVKIENSIMYSGSQSLARYKALLIQLHFFLTGSIASGLLLLDVPSSEDS